MRIFASGFVNRRSTVRFRSVVVILTIDDPKVYGDRPTVGRAFRDEKERGVTPRSEIRRAAHAKDTVVS